MGREQLAGCAILTPTNEEELLINDRVLQLLPGEEKVSFSIDSVEGDTDAEVNYPLEYLHSLTPFGPLPGIRSNAVPPMEARAILLLYFLIFLRKFVESALSPVIKSTNSSG